MIHALFHPSRNSVNPDCLALGFTLTRAEPKGSPLGNRELEVTRALASACAANGYSAPLHVLDEPEKWGVDTTTGKEHEDTLTCWYVVKR